MLRSVLSDNMTLVYQRIFDIYTHFCVHFLHFVRIDSGVRILF